MNDDPLAAAKGCLLGALIGTGLWAIVATIAMIVWKAMQK